jgi:hypothetical protein
MAYSRQYYDTPPIERWLVDHEPVLPVMVRPHYEYHPLCPYTLKRSPAL